MTARTLTVWGSERGQLVVVEPSVSIERAKALITWFYFARMLGSGVGVDG